MRLQEIERLKKDRNKATYYRERLLKKGKSDKAFKMQKKIEYLDEYIEELRYAPSEEQSASMTVIKLCYASSLPDPNDLLDKLSNQEKKEQLNTSGARCERPISAHKGAYSRLLSPAPYLLSGRKRFHRPSAFAIAFNSSTTGNTFQGPRVSDSL